MHLFRVVLSWAGAPVVGSAVTVLHYDGSNQSAPPVAAIRSALASVDTLFTNNVTITVPSSGDIIEDTTGELTGVWSAPAGNPVPGFNTGAVAAGVGACIGWTTGGIVNGKKGPRKLRGRTFVVPLAGAAYQNDGTLSDQYLGYLNTLASGLRAAGPLAVWHRPTTPGGSDGNSYGVISHKVRDKVAFLSSRRD